MREILIKTCRLCLAIHQQDKELVFVKISDEQKEKFENLTGIELLLDDNHPTNTCIDCSDLLENFYFYKHQLIKKQNDLKDIVGNILQKEEEEKLENLKSIDFPDEILEEHLIGNEGMLSAFDDYEVSHNEINEISEIQEINEVSNDNEQSFSLVIREELQYEDDKSPKIVLHPIFTTPENNTDTFIIGIEEIEDDLSVNMRQFICNFCGNVYHNRRDMRSHLRSHNYQKKYQCNFEGCNKAFRYQHHLVNHERTHTQSSPFQCDQCSSSFRQKYALTLHQRKHSKMFLECSRCKSQFVMQSQLNKHEQFNCDGVFRPYIIRARKNKKS